MKNIVLLDAIVHKKTSVRKKREISVVETKKIDIDNENVIVYSAIKEQINEEKVKAKKILSETNSEEWKKRIIEAENSLFFRGAIRFLFQDDNCQEDWSQFDKKLSKAKECFNKDGELQGNNILLRI